jgi:hypothetical protein
VPEAGSSIEIFLFAHKRQRYLPKILREIWSIREDLKHKVTVTLLFDSAAVVEDMEFFEHISKREPKTRILFGQRYLDKVLVMSKSSAPFVVKCDEDIYMSADCWSQYLDHILEGAAKDGVLAPLISSGIPTFELFVETFIPKHSRDLIASILRGYVLSTTQGSLYGQLDGVYDFENPDVFYRKVGDLCTPLKGVHPIRVSREAQELLLDAILRLSSWVEASARPILDFSKSPYFAVNVFSCSRTFFSEMAGRLFEGEYFNDNFDELAINQHLDYLGRPLFVAQGCVAIHPSYNSIGPFYEELSDRLFDAV